MTKIEKLREMVIAVTQLLNDNNFVYWVDFGTLLGIVRDGDLITWDEDVDISYYHSDRDILLYLLEELNLDYYIHYVSTGKVRLFYSSDIYTEPWIDFYSWIDTGKPKLQYAGSKSFPLKLWPYKNIIGTRTKLHINNWDTDVFVPKEYTTRLKNLYKNWKQPIQRVPYWR